MKKLLVALMLVGVLSAGCGAEKVLAKIFQVEETIIDATNEAEPIIAMLENAVPDWKGMDKAEQSKIINACDTFQRRGIKLKDAVAMIGNLYPAAKPVTFPVSMAITLLTTAAGAFGTFISRRKANQHKAVAVATMRAGDKAPRFGASVNNEARIAGVADVANAIYKENILTG